MKYILKIVALATTIFISSCSKENSCSTGTMTPVSVISGSISNGTFTPGTDFQIENDAIGAVQDPSNACSRPINALKDQNNDVFIFESNTLPKTVDQKLFNELSCATWTKVKEYKLANDASVFINTADFIIHIREAGEYPIYEASINGEKVFKYPDTHYIEDYKNFLTYHEWLRPQNDSPILIDFIRGIKPNEYTTRVGASGMPLIDGDGRVNYATGTATAAGVTDKIYFEKAGEIVNYRLRHVYIDPTFKARLAEKYFDKDGKILIEYERLLDGDNSNNPIFIDLNKYYEPYIETTITGYDCSVSRGASGLDSPPLPIGG